MHQSDNATYFRSGSEAPLEYGQTRPSGHRHDVRRVALVGTYPPTECGIATFTANVRDALLQARPDWVVSVVSLVDETPEFSRPEVAVNWIRNQAGSLQRAVDYLNTCDVVVIQHEFGIYGGRDGDDVLELVDSLRVPVVVSLHTVLRTPTVYQHFIVQRLIDAADLVVVPSASALDRLTLTHRVRQVAVVPHGAEANFDDDRPEGEAPVVLTWGLLGPGKGLEHGIHALALLDKSKLAARYIISGRTHPHLRLSGTDPYRDSLEQVVAWHGVGDVVSFDDRYLGWKALRAMVRRATVVLLPYQSRDQISSGVLVEALASGKPIVSTRFPHAVELLSDGAGILVDFDDAEGMAQALRTVLERPDLAHAMSQRARRVGRSLLWPQVGQRLSGLLEELTEMVKR